MRKFRQLHLWIGLLTSILILVESVTGLLLSEPWLMGQTSKSEMRMPVQAAGTAAPYRQDAASTAPAAEVGNGNNQGTNNGTNGQQGKPARGSGQQGSSFY
ncbi:PepSY domain-containing protein [Paenibacillus allorhizosphaerae]|uniref:PepSY domain-containing protein n=1 Tax=Paenibacillus allorhizosphaerae TaxID=2849866 RepID=A0ABN7TM52_9BACL|nr:PepSY domain-containing protein [Paenibacillus allorhizosphaerae]CAG7638954.1 hypothetical protein PAECIP111802_02493 [Paenibacillus allorhizosphaerae]